MIVKKIEEAKRHQRLTSEQRIEIQAQLGGSKHTVFKKVDKKENKSTPSAPPSTPINTARK